jgi:hypothetical protein
MVSSTAKVGMPLHTLFSLKGKASSVKAEFAVKLKKAGAV